MTEKQPKSQNWRVLRLIAHLESAYVDQGVTVQAMSAKFHISPRRLGSLFKRHTGITMHQYLRRLRMSKGVDLLQSTALSVKEIAAATGYCSTAHFDRDFKHTFGVKPGEYRSTTTQ
jgi:two-component system response regulator YesN